MTRLILILLFLPFLNEVAFSQEGFINTYDLGYSGSTFHGISVVDDTLLCIGLARDTTEGGWGIQFTKLDTLGNILFTRRYSESERRRVYLRNNSSVIKTSDGGYALCGHDYTHAYFLKLDAEGNMEFYTNYEFDVLLVKQKKIIEIEGGYLLSGSISENNYIQNLYVIKIDRSGNEQWRRIYGMQHTEEWMKSFIKLNDNAFAIGGGIAYDQPNSSENDWSKSRIMVIDSLGDIQWDWTSEEEYNYINQWGLNAADNGSWVFINALIHYPWGTSGNYEFRLRFIEIDSLGQVVHEKFFSPFFYSTKWVYDMIPDGHGNWVAAGESDVDYSNGDYGVAAWTIKFSPEGDTLWTRKDSVIWNSNIGFGEAIQGGIIALSSGSTIGAGYTNYFGDTYARSYPFLIKLDKDGCIIPGCRPPVSTTTTQYIPEIEVYPNPTTGQIYVRAESPFSLEVYDASGKVHFRKQEQGEELSIDASLFSEGMYFLRMRFDDERVVLHKVIKH